MTNLTDKWKKGKLPDDEYYCRTTHDSSVRKHYLSNIDTENMIEILAPVPSFELWQAVHEQWKVLLEENTKLKSLLKECKHIMSIEKDFASCHFEKDKLCKLLAKINQVLGEE